MTRSTTASGAAISTALTLDVIAYIAVGAARVDPRHDDVAHARRDRAAHRARPPPRPLRPPHVALAEVLLAAEGRLDHRAADERRRRALGRPQPGADDARRQLAHAGRGDRRPLPARLAPRARRAARAAARDPRHALVPAHLARRVRRRPHADRRGDRAARRVGLRDGGRPGVQPRDAPSSASSPSSTRRTASRTSTRRSSRRSSSRRSSSSGSRRPCSSSSPARA